MTSFINKYKDKSPEETIDNVKKFFTTKNYVTDVVLLEEPMPNIWWCVIKLKYNDVIIQSANGKGVTKEFALASGYSELYERYCNFCGNILGQKINQTKLFELNLKKNGYRLFPDEKYINPEDIFKNDLPILKQFCDSINDNENSLLKYLKNSYPEGLLSLPYNGFNTSDTITLPFILSMIANGSSGMAAGNSIEEALTQGLSEICEHYVHYEIYRETRKFYYLDLSKIELSDNLKAYFEKLDNNGYNYYIYDFSYLYQMPVLGLLIVDPRTHVSYLDLGAAPSFNIALERCCTEIYQGHTILGDNHKQNMLPSRALALNTVIEQTLTCMPLAQYYPENLILNSEQIDAYNHKIFLDNNNYSNIELNNYYRNIFNHKKWEVYYRDFSQDQNIKAIKCYIKNIPIMNVNIDNANAIDKSIQHSKWNQIMLWEALVNEYFTNKVINENLFNQIIQLINELRNQPVSCSNFFMTDLLRIPKSKDSNLDFFVFWESLIHKNWDIFFMEAPEDFSILRHYLILLLYGQHYSSQEIQKIGKFYNINYTNEDLQNSKNLIYILDKIYFSVNYNYYFDEKYESLMETYIPVVIK